jgi:hypothetical protein
LFSQKDALDTTKSSAVLYGEALREINQEGIKNSTADVTKLQLLRDILTDTTKSQQTRTAALKEYNSIADKANQIDESQINNLNLINDKISTQIDLIEKRGLARAAETIIAQRAEKLLLAQEAADIKVREDTAKEEAASAALNRGTTIIQPKKAPSLKVGDTIRVFNKTTGKMEEVTVTENTLQQFGVASDKFAKDFEKINKENRIKTRITAVPEVVIAQKELDSATAIFRDKIANSFAGDKQPTDPKTKDFRGSKLSGELKDELKLIESERLRLLSIENTSANDIQKVRKLTFDEEVAHLNAVEKINVDALNKKIALLNQKKSLNAEEQVTMAKFREELSGIELDTSQKIQAVEKARFTEQEQDLKNQLDQTIQLAKDASDKIQEDVNSTPFQRAEARLEADNKILAGEELFYQQLLKLNSDFNKQSVVQAQKAIDATKKLIDKDTRELSVATLVDIDTTTEKALADIKTKYDKLKADILKSSKSDADKNAALSLLGKLENIDVNTKQQEGLNKKLETGKKLYDAGLITLKQYEDIYAQANNGQKNLNASIEAGKKNITSFGALLQSNLGKLFGFTEGGDKAKLLGETITQTFATATNAMNTFFDSENQRIEESLSAQQKRIDKQKEQELAQAQTLAQRDSIEKQFAAKREALDKDAFEKHKKIQLAQAQINLAMQLSNLAVVAFAPNPANIATLGVAGAIMYGVQAALAFTNYFLNVSRISSARFKYGGSPDQVPTRGGEFGGRPHDQGGTPFGYKGRHYEAEVAELAVIRTRNASANRVYSMTGTQRQIASMLNVAGGGVSFASGGRRMFDYGGNLGAGLGAPVYVPSAGNTTFISNNTDMLEEMRGMRNDMQSVAEQTSKRIDRH